MYIHEYRPSGGHNGHDTSMSHQSFSKQNSKLRIHPKADRNQSKLTVCNAWLKLEIEFASMNWNENASNQISEFERSNPTLVRHFFDKLKLTLEVKLNNTLIYQIRDMVRKQKNNANL